MGYKKRILSTLSSVETLLKRLHASDFGVAKEREKDRIYTMCGNNPKKIRKYIRKYPARTTVSPIGQAHFEILRWLQQQEELDDDVPF